MNLNLRPRTLFLIDAFGALISAFFLGIVLVHFQALIGMPVQLLHALAVVALGFSVYSFTCYFFNPLRWRPYLRFIAVVNLLYCVATSLLVVRWYEVLTVPGLIYFLGELILVVFIASMEWRCTQK